jgi:DNA-binding CsgD family transcriptional regulator/tetratricopeptide (TPR) repeat protein
VVQRTEQLLGRHAEFGALRSALRDATDGRGAFVVVSGEAGIGKSRLLESLSHEARSGNCLAFAGRAAEFEAGVPFAVLIDAMDSYLRTLDRHSVERLSLDRLGSLAAVFPALAGLAAEVDVPVNAGERFRVHRAVGDLLERLAVRQPVLLTLDDLHWADPASLELAAHLARRPPDGAVLVVLGVRSGPLPDFSERLLTGIRAADHVRVIDVPPLDRAALGELVGSTTPADVDRWYELTRGNPFYAVQLARAGVVPGQNVDVNEVPEVVRAAIRLEIDALPPAAQQVVASAAVLGDPFDLDLVLSAADESEDAVLVALDQLCTSGIVRATEAPRVFAFRHPLVRSAIYLMTPPGSRIACHRKVAEHLRERGARPVELARHVEQSARFGDMDAVEVLGRAAEAAISTAPASATRWLSTALTLLPASASVRRRIALLGHLANAHAAQGDLTSGLAALHRSLAIVPADDDRALANVAIACSEGERLLGHPDVGAATLRDAHDRLGDRNSADAARIAMSRASNAFYLGAYDDTLKWADEAVRIAERLGDAALIVAARSSRLAGAAFSGHIAGARELHAMLMPQLDGLDDEQVAPLLDTVRALAAAELYLDLYADSYAHAIRGLSIARHTGRTHLMPMLTPVAGTAAWMIGEIDASIQVLDDAIEAARMTDNDAVLAWHLFNRSLPELALGDVDQAVRFSEESWRRAAPLPAGMIRAFAAAAHASSLHAMGRSAEALDLLYGAAGGPELGLLAGAWRGVWFEIAVDCHLRLGDPVNAGAAVERAHVLADEVPTPLAMMTADRAAAAHALATGAPARSVELLCSALAHAETMRSPVHVAWCRELLGHALLAAGDRSAGVRELAIASEMSDALGTFRHRDRIDAELRRHGETVHRRTRPGARDASGLEALTGRELEVAELIRDHATNREIAGELFLSQKTVETHVRNIFNKLGVSSRAQIARALAAAGPT